MIFLRYIQIVNCFVMVGAMCIEIFGKETLRKKAENIRLISTIICWVFILTL